MSSVPMAAPSPAPAAPAAAKGSAAATSSKASGKNSDHVSSSSDLSFLSFMLAGFMNTQSFPTTIPAGESNEPVFTPVSFGGTYNMDPSMLVLPEGIDASALVAAGDGQANFSAELLAALTPGVPSEISAVGLSADGQVTFQMEGDPRLIATGLDPVQMQAMIAKLSALPATGDQAAAVPAVPSTVAIVSFLPDTPVEQPAVPVTVAAPAPVVPVNTNVAVDASAVVVPDADEASDIVTALLKKIDTTTTSDDTASADVNVAVDEDGFDPLEFRLAMKPSRYGTSNPYQVAAPAPAPVAAPAQSVSANVDAAIKGTMKADPGDASGPGFTSSLDANVTTGSTDTLITSSALLSPTILTPTPAQGAGLTNPVLQNITAVQSHPATQAVAAIINKNVQGSTGAQTLAIQLDPPELGRMHLKMKYEKGEPLRVHVVLEKADTMAMLQRDSHALENALSQAGLKTDSSTLTFDLGGQNAFGQMLGDQNGSGSNTRAWTPDMANGAADEPIETQLSVVIDPKTGLAHYNVLV